MAKLIIGNTYTQVIDPTQTEVDRLNRVLSHKDTSSAFVRLPTGKVKWTPPKTVPLFVDGCIPAGLSSTARDVLRTCEIEDSRDRPITPNFDVNTDWARPYQREAAETAVRKTKGIIHLPTGTGKTEVAVMIARLLDGATTLVITPDADLVHNMADRFEKRTGMRAGRWGDGHRSRRDKGFTTATMQTVVGALRRQDPVSLAFLRRVDALLIDEVHQTPAEEYYSAAMQIPAYWRIGMSGKPLSRSDGRAILAVAATGGVIYTQPAEYFFVRGWLSRPEITLVEVKQEGPAKDFRSGYGRFIAKSKKRNSVVAKVAQIATKPGLLFVRQIEHGKLIAHQLRQAGLRVEFVWGGKSTSARKAAISRLERGELDIIVCNQVFVTGTDIPTLRSVINAMGHKSVTETIQVIGRGTRVADGKTTFELWDIFDTASDLRSGNSGNQWNHRHSRERRKIYLGEGYDVKITAADDLA